MRLSFPSPDRRPTIPLLALAVAVMALGGCTSPDEPAYFSRMGRFMGLVANCGCSDIPPAKMVSDYRKAVEGRYSEKDIVAMKGYVEAASTENWDNEPQVCAEICSQRCMVTAVAEPLGGKGTGEPACLVNERDLRTPAGAKVDSLEPSN